MQAFAIAAAGVSAAISRFDVSAQRTVRWGTTAGEGVELAQEAVEQIGAKAALEANMQVMRTADEMLGALLDIKA